MSFVQFFENGIKSKLWLSSMAVRAVDEGHFRNEIESKISKYAGVCANLVSSETKMLTHLTLITIV